MKYWVAEKKILGSLKNALRILTEKRKSLRTQNPAIFAPENLFRSPELVVPPSLPPPAPQALIMAVNFCRHFHSVGQEHLTGQFHVMVNGKKQGWGSFVPFCGFCWGSWPSLLPRSAPQKPFHQERV